MTDTAVSQIATTNSAVPAKNAPPAPIALNVWSFIATITTNPVKNAPKTPTSMTFIRPNNRQPMRLKGLGYPRPQ